MSEHYDVIILGASLDGLAAAAVLAKAGKTVLVLEERAAPGGPAGSAESLPGFTYNTAFHDLGWNGPTGLQKLTAGAGLAPLQANPGVISLLDNDCLPLWNDPVEAAAAIKRFSPADAARWPDFVRQMQKLAGFLELAYSQAPPEIFSSEPGEGWRLLGLGRALKGLGSQDMMEMVRLLPMSARELLDDWFESDPLKGAVGALGITNIMQGPRASGTALMMLHHLVGQPPGRLRGPRLPKGGIGRQATALAEAARQAGAEIRCSSALAAILHRDGQVSGVGLADGQELAAGRVLSTYDLNRTMLNWAEPFELDPEYVRQVKNIRYRGARLKVNLALSELPRFAGVAEGMLNGFISVSPSLDYLEKAYDDAKYGRVSEQPYLEAFIPTLADPGLAPPGQHVLSVWLQYAPYQLRSGAWDEQARQAAGDLAVDTLAGYAPNLKDAILHRQVLSPLDLENEYGATGGNLYQGEIMLDQFLFMRPIAGYASYQTPIMGLFIGGPAAHPGGGNAGACGYLAAQEMLKS